METITLSLVVSTRGRLDAPGAVSVAPGCGQWRCERSFGVRQSGVLEPEGEGGLGRDSPWPKHSHRTIVSRPQICG